MSFYHHRRAARILSVIFAVAVVVSIIHYTDNYVNYHDYPQPRTGPNPSAPLILGAWFGFTAAGLAGYHLWHRDVLLRYVGRTSPSPQPRFPDATAGTAIIRRSATGPTRSGFPLCPKMALVSSAAAQLD